MGRGRKEGRKRREGGRDSGSREAWELVGSAEYNLENMDSVF